MNFSRFRPYQNWLEVALKSWSSRFMAFAVLPQVWDFFATWFPTAVPEAPWSRTITSILVAVAFFAKLVPQGIPKVMPEPVTKAE